MQITFKIETYNIPTSIDQSKLEADLNNEFKRKTSYGDSGSDELENIIAFKNNINYFCKYYVYQQWQAQMNACPNLRRHFEMACLLKWQALERKGKVPFGWIKQDIKW